MVQNNIFSYQAELELCEMNQKQVSVQTGFGPVRYQLPVDLSVLLLSNSSPKLQALSRRVAWTFHFSTR